ncbi:hypothetical protein NECID01_0152 [Nematocida sp. AWRm77]|nr:hypothetical protein NECID01_0152 [Nematocida sp. AWRm77]
MEHVIKELCVLKKAAKKHNKAVEKKEVDKMSPHKALFFLVEEALSKVYCKYALDLVESLVSNRPSDMSLHKKLDRTLQVLKKTKELVDAYIQATESDPIPHEYISTVLSDLGYTPNTCAVPTS